MAQGIVGGESLDALVEELRQLRRARGDVSYAEIAVRVAAAREARGMTPAAARVARSSVFDVFRTGRTRINAELAEEIVRALGSDPDEAARWRDRFRTALPAMAPRATPAPVPTPTRRALAVPFVVVLMTACVGLNLFGGAVVMQFRLPIWLDMVGTGIAAIALGPWHGALVGLATNGLGTLSGQPETLPFALVNVAGALVWGYGFRAWRAAGSPLRFLLLNTGVALVCTLVAVPINVLLLDGAPAHGSAGVIATLSELGEGVWVAVLSANLLLSIVDKQLSGFAAALVAGGLGRLKARSVDPVEA